MTKQFDINAVVTCLLKDYVQRPTFEELKAELAQHEFVVLKDHFVNDAEYSGRYGHVTGWYKIQFVLAECVIVEDVLLTCGRTRFDTHKIMLAHWDRVFGEWIDENHHRFADCNESYVEGMREWGADV